MARKGKKKRRDESSSDSSSSGSSSDSDSDSSSSSSSEDEREKRRAKKKKQAKRKKAADSTSSSSKKDRKDSKAEDEAPAAGTLVAVPVVETAPPQDPKVLEKTLREAAGAEVEEAVSKQRGRKGKNGRRRNYRTKKTALEDDDDTTTVATGLMEAKMLQKARRRGAGTCWTAEEEVEGEEETTSELQSVVHGSAVGGLVNATSAFRSEDDSGASKNAITSQREQFVEEKLKKIRMGDERYAKRMAAEAAENKEKPKSLEDALYEVPEFLKQEKEEIEEAGDRWLTGITEVPLPISVKLDNIERTEQAKQTIFKKTDKKTDGRALGNLTSNFQKHRRDFAEKCQTQRDESMQYRKAKEERENGPLEPGVNAKKRGVPEHGHSGGKSAVPYASDDKVVDRFVKRYKYKL